MVGEAGALGFQAWLLAPLAAFLGYALLFFLVVREPQDSPIRGFTFYVGALVAWSFSSLMIVLGVEPTTGFWEYVVMLAYVAVPCAFFWFVLVCWRENGRRYILPLGGFAFAAAVVLSGAAVIGVRADGHRVVLEYGPLAPYLHLFLGVYIVLILFALVRMLRNASHTPARLKLPLAGALLVLVGFVGGLSSATGYPVESLFHLGNVALIGFAVFRHHLLSTGGVWGYSLLFLGLAGVFTGIALLAVYLAGVALQFQTVLFWLAMGVLLTALYQPLNDGMQRLINRMTKLEKRREMVAHFINVAPTILDLRELVDLMLAVVGRVFRCRYACLFLKDYQRNQYRLYTCSAPSEVPVAAGEVVTVDEKNLVVQWLREREEIVEWDVVEGDPDMRELIENDAGVFRKLGARVLVSLNLRGEMMGFLLLSHRLFTGPYSAEDRALLTSLTSQAAVAIGNARLYDHARTEAITDGLTGLFNRRFLEEAIQRELARHSRYGHKFCVLLTDVDYFKKYNDQRGHLAGDKALVRLGRTMKKMFRGTDVVARYGGEEFAVLLPETGVEQAVLTAERLRATLARELVPDDPEFGPLTVSIGVSGCPVHGVTAEELFQRADEALYQAKELGRNLVCLNTHNMKAGGEDGYLQ